MSVHASHWLMSLSTVHAINQWRHPQTRLNKISPGPINDTEITQWDLRPKETLRPRDSESLPIFPSTLFLNRSVSPVDVSDNEMHSITYFTSSYSPVLTPQWNSTTHSTRLPTYSTKNHRKVGLPELKGPHPTRRPIKKSVLLKGEKIHKRRVLKGCKVFIKLITKGQCQ